MAPILQGRRLKTGGADQAIIVKLLLDSGQDGAPLSHQSQWAATEMDVSNNSVIFAHFLQEVPVRMHLHSQIKH